MGAERSEAKDLFQVSKITRLIVINYIVSKIILIHLGLYYFQLTNTQSGAVPEQS